ncbi:MAG: hypothetical protein ACI8ZN_002282 [Bacteroidia bacterium]|jgi:hypothetical protein
MNNRFFLLKTSAISFLVFFSTSVFAQYPDLKYANYVYDDLVETVIMTRNGSIYNPVPIIGLGSVNSLVLKFDKLEASNEFYQYTYVHCSSNWEPSNLQKSEYIEGQTMGEVKSFTFSSNTFQQYVNYKMTFPSADMKLTKSGNYLIKIFRNFDENDLVLTQRFMMVENVAKVDATVKPATGPKDRFSKQEVDFDVDYENYSIQNPFNDVKAVILQNNSWNSAIFNLKPVFVNNNVLSFNYEDENLFLGTNEYRFFDIRTLRLFSLNVREKFTDSMVNVVLRGDESRAHLEYVQMADYNGKRVIQSTDGMDVTEQGDYALVHFTFRSEQPISAGDIYLYGEMTNWQIHPKYKLTYFPAIKAYYTKVKLKQSYYNYQYVVLDEEEEKADFAFTEGNHSETENDYQILIYHYDLFYGYDRLIASGTANSRDTRR